MKKRVLRISAHTALLCFEVLAALTGLLVLAGGVLIWRLKAGPVPIDFARGYVESALQDPVSGYGASLGGMALRWPDLRGPVMLSLDDVVLVREGQTVLDVKGAELGLSAGALLAGRVRPVSIVLNGPALHLTRTEDNNIVFSMEGESLQAAEAETDGESPLTRILKKVASPEGSVDPRSPVAHLDSVAINGARMIVDDHFLGITWFLPDLDLMFARDRRGLVATASLDLPGGHDRAGHIQADMAWARDEAGFGVNLHVQDFDPRVLSRKIGGLDWLNGYDTVLNGNIEMRIGGGMELESLDAAVVSQNGYLDLEGVYDKPFPYESLEIQAAYDRAQSRIDLRNLTVKAGGLAVTASSAVSLSEGKITAPLRISVPELRPEQLGPLWPDSLRDEGAEIWLTQKMSAGRVHDAEVGLTVEAQKTAAPDGEESWAVSASGIEADFSIEKMDVDYRPPLSPARGISGKGRYENDTIDIDVTGAVIEGMTVEKGHVKLKDVSKAATGNATITMDLKGDLPSVFRYVSREPIGLDKEETGIDHKTVKGGAGLSVHVSFPMIRDLKTEQVVVKLDGELDNVHLPGIVKNLDLTGGVLKVSVADGMLNVAGSGKIDGRDVRLAWAQYLESAGKPFSGRLTADLDADYELRKEFGAGLEDWLEGTVPVHVVYTEFPGGGATADIDADLTPARLKASPLDYDKPPGEAGRARCKATLAQGEVSEVSGFDVEAPGLKMTGARLTFGGKSVLRRGEFPRITAGETDIGVEMEVGPDRQHRIKVKGDFLDARPYLKRKKDPAPYDGPPLLVSVDVARMRTHPARLVSNAKLYMDMSGAGDINQFEMDATAGKGAIYFRLKPDAAGKMNLRLEADDAGATLQAFGVYENARGGKLVVQGEAPDAASRKTIRGTALMTDFRVVNAPVLARLLSAISLFGITELLGNDGIYFSKLESAFEWRQRRQGDLYGFSGGRTSGSSLGLTFEGRIDRASGETDIAGTIIPVSLVNELISSIPLVGDILAGGKDGAVIAATYTVKGPSENPTTSVNPLAALAPGILRRILFED